MFTIGVPPNARLLRLDQPQRHILQQYRVRAIEGGEVRIAERCAEAGKRRFGLVPATAAASTAALGQLPVDGLMHGLDQRLQLLSVRGWADMSWVRWMFS